MINTNSVRPSELILHANPIPFGGNGVRTPFCHPLQSSILPIRPLPPTNRAIICVCCALTMSGPTNHSHSATVRRRERIKQPLCPGTAPHASIPSDHQLIAHLDCLCPPCPTPSPSSSSSFKMSFKSFATVASFLWVVMVVICPSVVHCQFDWQKPDAFDQIQSKLDSVGADNCRVVDINKLFLPPGTVTHVPDFQSIGINPIFPNRTNLLHIHNMALSRAFFLR